MKKRHRQIVVASAIVVAVGAAFGVGVGVGSRSDDDAHGADDSVAAAQEADDHAPHDTVTDGGAGTDAATPADETDGAADGASEVDAASDGQSAADGAVVAPPPLTEGGFVATFDGNTGFEAFDTDVHHRNVVLGDEGGHNSEATWPGDHDMNCSPPDQTRVVHADHEDEYFYLCRDHMMTSLGDIDGYSIVSFSPKEVFATISRVCWDQNVTWSSLRGRQWTELVVRPADELPADGRLSHTNASFRSVDDTALAHGPTTVGVMMQGPGGVGAFYGGVQAWYDDFYFQDEEAFSSKAIRRQHCLTDNKNGTLTLSIDQGAAGIYENSFDGSFPENARVIFEDHKYTPNKIDHDGDPPTTSYTWHWDNIVVDP